MNSTGILQVPRQAYRLIAFAFLVGVGYVIVTYTEWVGGLTMGILVGVPAILFLLSADISDRLVIFFFLFTVSDFLKKATMLIPEQNFLAQYVVWLLPHGIFLVFILLPSLEKINFNRYDKLIGLFMFLSLLFTVITGGFSLISKLAAIQFYIVPWTMVWIIARIDRGTLYHICKVMVYLGIISAVYGIFQAFYGPTTVELSWAEQTGDLSMGSGHLTTALQEGELWRPVGMQPDTHTFALFMTFYFLSAWLLHTANQIGKNFFNAIAIIFAVGLILSLARTVWVAYFVLLIAFFVLRSFDRYFKPAVILGVLILGFFMSEWISSYLASEYGWLSGTFENPMLERGLRTGTLEARVGAVAAFGESLKLHWFRGAGFCATPWLSSKFGGESDVSSVGLIATHNMMGELLNYVGLPGLILFFVIIYLAVDKATKAYHAIQNDAPQRRELLILSSGIFAVLFSGFANGLFFLGYYFYFFLGFLINSAISMPSSIHDEKVSGISTQA